MSTSKEEAPTATELQDLVKRMSSDRPNAQKTGRPSQRTEGHGIAMQRTLKRLQKSQG